MKTLHDQIFRSVLDPYFGTCTTVGLNGDKRHEQYRYMKKMKHTGDFECSQITQVLTVHSTPTKNIHDIIHKCCSMPLTGGRYETDTVQLCPFTSSNVERPSIIIMELAVRASKAKEYRINSCHELSNGNTYTKTLSLYVTQTCPVRARGAGLPSTGRYSSHTGAAAFTATTEMSNNYTKLHVMLTRI